jgi:Carboxypeptidase regulatory-like domain/TonB dependent receptor
MRKFRGLAPLQLLGLLVLVLDLPTPVAEGQTLTSSATLSGSVADPSGASVPNATVTVTDEQKGITRVFETRDEGAFSFPLLPAGTYALTVQAAGFKTYKQEAITLSVGQSATHNVTLTVGATEELVVTGTLPLLQTGASIGAVLTTKQVTELPLSLRNVFNFVELNASVNSRAQKQTISSAGRQGSADQDASFFNFGGSYFGTNAFLLDGTWDVSGGWGGVIYLPSPDNVQEFKIEQNSFSAQYGWSTGNVITIVTKSGSSDLHGDAYYFLRDDALDANHYFNNLNGIPRPESDRKQYGVAVGGPVYIPGVYKQRDRTFFFFNYEGHRENNALNSGVGTVPIPAFRSGDFSSLLGSQVGTDALGRPVASGQVYDPFSTRAVTAGQIDPVTGLLATRSGFIRDPIPGNNLAAYKNGSLINAIGKNLIDYYPAPLNSQAINNWSAAGLGASNSDETSVRIDHNLSDNTRIYGRYSYKPQFKDQIPAFFGDNPAGPGVINPNDRWSFAVGASHVFGPTLTMSVNVGGMRWGEGNIIQSDGFQSSTLGLPAFLDGPQVWPAFPKVLVASYLPIGPGADFANASFPRSSGSGSLDFVKVKGQHQLSFGYMGAVIQENGGRVVPTTFNFDNLFTGGPDPTNPTANTGDGMASLMLGVPVGGFTGVTAPNDNRMWLHGLYVQDDWRATRKLTLNLGLRWDIQRPYVDRFNRLFTFNYDAVNPISEAVGQQFTGQVEFATPENRLQYNNNFKHFAPRVGFAYQLREKIVMRGGYGIYFPSQYINAPQITGYNSNTPYVASINGGISPCTIQGPCTPDTALTLSNAFPNGLVPIVGNSLAGLTNVGFSTNAVMRDRKTYYVQQWSFGFQYAPTASDVIDVTYVGNHGTNVIASGLNLNQIDPAHFSLGNALLDPVPNPFFGHITASGCGLDQPTVPRGQLLRPHPQFCDINEIQSPSGSSNYNSLQLNYTHRVSQGLTLLASYTFSKFLDTVGGPETWANASANFSENIRNVYDLAAEKSVDATDVPHSLVLSYVYELPIGRGRRYGSDMNAVVDAVVGGWQTSGIWTAKSGFPLTITSSGNGLNYFGAGQHVNVVGDYRIDNPTREQWFNTSAFAVAAPWTQGDAPRYFSDLRTPDYNNFDLSIQKYFVVRESVRVQFRLDMFNAFNHTNFYKPNTFMGAGFGTITDAWNPRQMQAALKLFW